MAQPGRKASLRWAASLLFCLNALALAACERPPEPPPTEIELEHEENELSEEIEQIRSQATQRAESARERVPEADAGSEDQTDVDTD